LFLGATSAQGLPPLAYALGAPESGMRNIHSDPRLGETSQGLFQINDATWRDFAPKAGVDTNQIPHAMQADPATQWAVAQQIPLNRWTAGMRGVMAAYPGVDARMTVGQIAQQVGEGDGGPFRGAATAQPVAGTGYVAPAPG